MIEKDHDVLIVGAGLAGLCLSISLSKAGYRVCLIEKETFPHHKVCGEYVSNECLSYLKSIEFDPYDLGAVSIDKLRISSPTGNELNYPLDLGGFGLSRFKLDHTLQSIAEKAGVEIQTGTKATGINQSADWVFVETTGGKTFKAKILAGAFGKRSILDKELDRKFLKKRSPFVGVKYHLKLPIDKGLISLHNFKGGYAGISSIEDDMVCFCYLARREIIRSSGGIHEAEKDVLSKNPYIKSIFKEAQFLWEKPLVISEISFLEKEKAMGRVFFIGDSAGMVAPLFGNGMAMAIRSSSILSTSIDRFLKVGLSLDELRKEYKKNWQANFRARMKLGRLLQYGFGKTLITENLIRVNKSFPPLAKALIKASHGKAF